jgi:hypothetical protein
VKGKVLHTGDKGSDAVRVPFGKVSTFEKTGGQRRNRLPVKEIVNERSGFLLSFHNTSEILPQVWKDMKTIQRALILNLIVYTHTKMYQIRYASTNQVIESGVNLRVRIPSPLHANVEVGKDMIRSPGISLQLD